MTSSISIHTPPRQSVSIHAPRGSSDVATQSHGASGAFAPRQSNLAINPDREGGPEPAGLLDARSPQPVHTRPSEIQLLLSREELAAYRADPLDFIEQLGLITGAEAESIKPVVVGPASTSSMTWTHLRAGAEGWLVSFFLGAVAEEGARFADPYVAPYGVPPGALSAAAFTLVGGGLAHLFGGPVAGGIRTTQGARPSPDDADLANLATLRAQKLRAFFSGSSEYFNDLDQARVAHLEKMAARDDTFDHSRLRKCMPAMLFPEAGAAWRAKLTDDEPYYYWHVLLTIGALTAPHLIDTHFGSDLADQLYRAGARLLYKMPWGMASSGLTFATQNVARKWVQKTDGDRAEGYPTAPRKGIHSPEGLAANLAALQAKEELLLLKEAKLNELHVRIVRQITDGEMTTENAQPLFNQIEETRKAQNSERLRVQYKQVKMRSTAGRDWLQIQKLASTVFKGKTKALPPHLKGVFTEAAMKMRSLGGLFGCWFAIGLGTGFSYFNVSQLGARPDPHVEGITGHEALIVVTNTVVLMELWKLRSPFGRYLFEPALGASAGFIEGAAKAIAGTVNWCCGRQRAEHAARSQHMQTELADIEAPAESTNGEPRHSVADVLQGFSAAAQMLLEAPDEGNNVHDRFSSFLNQAANELELSGNKHVLRSAIASLPIEALEMIIDCEFFEGPHSHELAWIARECLLDLVDARGDVHEVKGEVNDLRDALPQEDRAAIETILFENAMMKNLWQPFSAGHSQEMRQAFNASRLDVQNLLQRITPAQAGPAEVDAKVRGMLEAFAANEREEFPQLVDQIFDSLEPGELDAIVGPSESLQLRLVDGRVRVRIDEDARAFDRAIQGHFASTFAGGPANAGETRQQYEIAIARLREQFPREDAAGVRRMMMNSFADLLAMRNISALQVRTLFESLPNSELDAIRTYNIAPGRQNTARQLNVMRIARDCLAERTIQQAARTADAFAEGIARAGKANYADEYQEQMNATVGQLEAADLPVTPQSRRAWLMDSIALALAAGQISYGQLMDVFNSLPPAELAAIGAGAPSVHAQAEDAQMITLYALMAAEQRSGS